MEIGKNRVREATGWLIAVLCVLLSLGVRRVAKDDFGKALSLMVMLVIAALVMTMYYGTP